MSSLAKLVRLFGLLIATATAVMATGVQAQTCGVSGSTTVAPAIYDPFNPTGLAATSVTLTLTRINPLGGEKTGIVNFYLKSNSTAADGASIIPTSATGDANFEGFGNNVFYNFNASGPILQPTATTHPSTVNRFFRADFTGNNSDSNTFTVTFTLQFPPNLNLSAQESLPFDAIFSCTTSGGGKPTDQVGVAPGALVFPVTVLSALRTYYAGTDLAFGEIGNIPPVPPSPIRTNSANHIVVQSSGAYSVELTSQNGFKMKKPGAATVDDEIRYSLKFLGDTRGINDFTEINHTCKTTGGASVAEILPIQATLIDGGQGKNPSPTYTDYLTVTIAPLAYAVIGIDDCGIYTVD